MSENMSLLDAIYRRRAVRNYKPEAVDQSVIQGLIDAAIHAPTAMHGEPWSFVVIQDRDLLDRISESAKEKVRQDKKDETTPQARKMVGYVNAPNFHLFYNAPALVLICSKSQEGFSVADCWLAAENFMLAACARGLGTCVIGLAIAGLNTPEWKAELGIPVGTTVVAPIIVGAPVGETPVVPRKPPEILAWK